MLKCVVYEDDNCCWCAWVLFGFITVYKFVIPRRVMDEY